MRCPTRPHSRRHVPALRVLVTIGRCRVRPMSKGGGPVMQTRGLRKAVAVVGTVVAVLATGVGLAFANAANPLPDSKGTAPILVGTTIQRNADGSTTVLTGSVAVTVGGTWNWGTLSGSSTQSSCASRFGVGWAVDWW